MDITSRATYRTQVTKVSNSALEYLQSSNAQINQANADMYDDIEEELKVYIERLTAAHESLSRANRSLSDSIRAEDLKKECESIVEYEDKAISVLARLKQRLAKLQECQNRAFGASEAASNVPRSNSSQISAAKLPKLTLKSFSGDFREWLPFWEVFRTAVH